MSDTTFSPGFPLKDSRLVRATPFFYGWVVLAAATIGMGMTLPGQTAGISLFIDAIIADLGVSRSLVSLSYTVATVTAALALPFVGRGIDRFGPRRAVIVISLLFALACFWMGNVQGAVGLFAGFVMLRTLGQGSLSLVSLHAVNLWFVRRRGKAVGCMGVGLAVATAVFPLFVEPVLADIGWRSVYLLLAVLLAAFMLPVGGLLYREKPELFGLSPDGAPRGGEESVEPEAVLSLPEARRTLIFWIITAGGVCMSALGTGLLFHHFSIMAYNGVDRAVAALVYLPLGIVTAAANLGTGFLVDRIRPRMVLASMLLILSLLILGVPMIATLPAVWVYGSLFGVAQGMNGTIVGSAYAYYFGRTHIGAIKGFANSVFVGGAAIGPLIYAVGLDVFGSYVPPLLITAVIPVSIAALALFARKVD